MNDFLLPYDNKFIAFSLHSLSSMSNFVIYALSLERRGDLYFGKYSSLHCLMVPLLKGKELCLPQLCSSKFSKGVADTVHF